MCRTIIPVAACFGLVIGTADVRGQQVVVQQPSFQQSTTSSTVVVPDRGATGLGGTGSAAAVGSMSGPVPLGTSRAGGTNAGRMEARVWVHDFEAMDAALLGEERPAPPVARRSPARPRPNVRPGLPLRQRAAH
jgi:hypothetical protein